jgi:hypothetical protein
VSLEWNKLQEKDAKEEEEKEGDKFCHPGELRAQNFSSLRKQSLELCTNQILITKIFHLEKTIP